MVKPTQTEVAPVTAPAFGEAFTVILVVVIAEPQFTVVSVKVIVVTPALTPYTTPVVEPTVPTAVLLLLHVPVPPEAAASASVIVKPEHTAESPVIAPALGDAFTVMLVVVVAEPQLTVVSVKVIIVVPAPTPYSIPVTGSMVPTAVLLLLHEPVPPDAVASESVIVNPVQTEGSPVIAPAFGDALTVILVVVVTVPQLTLVSVKVIVVTPALTPYTTPVVAPTVPTAVLLLLHVPVPPDAVASARGIVNPVHTDEGPVIVPATGDAITVILVVVVAEPQETVVSVKVMIVVPALTPYKIPVTGSMVPTAVLLLLHVPVPPDAERSLNVMLVPVHTNEGPDIAPALGEVTTVTFIVAVAVPQEAVVSVKVIVVTPAPTP